MSTTDHPTEIESVIACLGDDAAKLLDANPEDEMAANMVHAAALLGQMQGALKNSNLRLDDYDDAYIGRMRTGDGP